MTTVTYDPFAGGELLRVSPTTWPQKEIIASAQMSDEANTAFNEAVSITLEGKLDRALLELCFNKLIKRHDILRATFSRKGDEICLHQISPFKLIYEDLRHFDPEAQNKAIHTLWRNIAISPMNLEEGPLFFAWVKQLSDSSFELIIAAHHVICDGWSIGLLLKELTELYRNQGIEDGLPLAESFFDYAEQSDAQEIANIDIDYWREKFKQLPPVLDLPLDKVRPTTRTFQADRFDFELDREIVAQLPKVAAKMKGSLVNVVLAGYFALLHRLTSTSDLVVGLAVAGQAVFNRINQVGHMIQLLPIRLTVNDEMPFEELVGRVKSEVLNASEHPRCTFGKLIEKMAVDRSRVPLICTIFNIDQPINTLDFHHAKGTVRTIPRTAENFEIFLNFNPAANCMTIEATYSTALFSEETIAAWMQSLEDILVEVVDNPGTKISDLILAKVIPNALRQSNETTTELMFPGFLSAFRAQVGKTPDAEAVVCADVIYSYKKLDQLSDNLAGFFLEKGIREGDVVGICCRRSEKMVAALLAIFKVGAAYLPLDPDYPLDRLLYMLEDSGAIAVIEDSSVPKGVGATGVKHFDLDDLTNTKMIANFALPVENPYRLAYIIYTSGSTGKPKGVRVHHRALINLLESMARTPGCGAKDRWLALTTLAFDMSVPEPFLPLICGATIIIADRVQARDGEKIADLINEHRVTLLQATPSTWRMLLASKWRDQELGKRTMKALIGGEPLPPDLIADLLPRVSELWNMYGPTETTVWSTCKRIRNSDAIITVGKPIANTQVYVLDLNLNPLPINVPGELFIGGEGVTLGYHNREELTAERFITHPALGRIYRTGDLAKILPNGEVRHLGRLDDQFKLRGYRIEPGDIEAALNAIDGIAQSAVVIRIFDQGDDRLVAYYVWEGQEEPEMMKIRQALQLQLPGYMIPPHFVRVDALPFTPNKKVDRKSLLNRPLDEVVLSVSRAAADEDASELSPTEQAVVRIFSEQLGNIEVRPNDDFFQLGGHSLTAIWLTHTVERECGVRVTLGEFFIQPTPRSVARLVDEKRRDNGKEEKQSLPLHISAEDSALLSPSQHRTWVICQLFPDATFYNLPSTFRLRGRLDVHALQESFRLLVHHQEALRTRLSIDGQEVVQQIGDIDEAPMLDLVDVSQEVDPLSTVLDWVKEQIATSFDLKTDWMYRCRLFRLGEDDHALFFMPHHIIFDGWSFDIFYGELNSIYTVMAQGNTPLLEPHLYEYRDYCHWKRQAKSGEVLRASVQRWKERLSPLPDMLDIHRDYRPDPNLDPAKLIALPIRLESQAVNQLRTKCEHEGVTLFMLFLAAYAYTLSRWTARDTFMIGTPFSGRDVPGCRDLVGLFVGAIPLRISINREGSIRTFLQEIKGVCVDAFGDPDVPFDELVREMQIDRHVDRNPIFQVFFGFQDARERKGCLGPIPLERINPGNDSVETDLEFWVRDSSGGLDGAFNYRRAYFNERHMISFRDAFLESLMIMAADPTKPLVDLDCLGGEDKNLYTQLNRTNRSYPHADIVSYVEAGIRQNPDEMAIISGSERRSFATMSARVDRLASYLAVECSIGAGDIVGIYMTRDADLLTAMLAILKTGAAYLPLDPGFPEARLLFMVEDAGTRLILCNMDVPATFTTARVDLRTDWPKIEASSPSRSFVSKANASDVAYVIYTSGSTGKPKGVAVGHRAAANFLQSMAEQPGLGKGDRLLAVTTLSFDISVLELFLPLCVGVTVVIASHEDSADGRRLMELVDEHDINVMQATPATWRMMLGLGWQGKQDMRVLCGGEALPPDLVEALLARCGELWNMYGPTETTVWSTCKRIEGSAELITVGRPIANTQIYILNDDMQPQPIGVPGELFIGGTGVAHGYHNRPELTAEKFLEHPQYGRIYRTGDRARVMGHGEVQHLGRLDDQIKLRGYRIELGDIEAALNAVDGIAQAAAKVIYNTQGDARLVGYFVREADSSITTTAVRSALRKQLPNYMVPTNLVILEALPLTPNGKIDRKSLPSLDNIAQVSDQKAPLETDSQRLMAKIWSELIGVSTIGPDDNFFQLGGHSLLAIKALKQINEKFSVELRPRLLIVDNLREVTRCATEGSGLTEHPVVKSGATVSKSKIGILERISKRFK